MAPRLPKNSAEFYMRMKNGDIHAGLDFLHLEIAEIKGMLQRILDKLNIEERPMKDRENGMATRQTDKEDSVG
jgi:aspartyl/asparaginyl-tRNA synthetase